MNVILTIINNNKIILAYLNNLESGVARKVINGEYVISFTVLIEELKTEFLHDENNLIEYNNDYFRVISLEEEHNSDNMLKVSCECEHISYDLIKQTKLAYTQTDRAAIYVMNDLLLNSGFNFIGTDLITTASIDVQQETDLKSLLYMVATIWGGELSYFQYDIELKQQLGFNRGADFRFGKNIQNIKRLIDRVDNTVSYEVEIVQGSELEELGYFELGDTIRVVDDMLKIEIETRIIETEKDIVTGINSRVVLGQPIRDLSTGFNNLFSNLQTLNNKIDSSTIELNNAIQGVYTSVEDIQTVLADGMITTYYQDTPPTDANEGDLWFKTNDNKLYLRNNSLWKLIEDAGITEAIQKAQDAQTTADGKIVSYYQDTMPTNANAGDLWIDTNDGNKLYRFNGTNWVSARDGSLALIDNVIDEQGNLIAEKLTGALNTAITKVENSTSTVSFDDRGIITHNQPLESTSVKAMLLTSDGILIANARNTDGTWKWRTAITADGISADEINTGTLTAININGVTIKGSDITSDDAHSEIKLNNGVLSVKKKATSQQFNINYKAGLPEGITQTELEYYNEYRADNINKLPTNTISLNSTDSYMDLAFGNAPISLGNDWVKMSMYGGSYNWEEAYPQTWADYLSGNYDYNDPPENGQGSKLIISLQGNYWVARDATEYLSAFVRKSTSIVLDAHDVICQNDFRVYGNKNCVVKTIKFGELDFSAYETADVYLGDIGEAEIKDGECVIALDEKLLACVNTDMSYQVFLTKYGQGDIWVAERNKTSFIVKGDNIKFGWEIKAKRKQYENIRFGQPKTR